MVHKSYKGGERNRRFFMMELNFNDDNAVILLVSTRGSPRVSVEHNLVQENLSKFHTVLVFSRTEALDNIYSNLLSDVFIHNDINDPLICDSILKSCAIRKVNSEKMLIVIQDQLDSYLCTRWKKLFEFAKQNPSTLNILFLTHYVQEIKLLVNFIDACIFCGTSQGIGSNRHFLNLFIGIDDSSAFTFMENYNSKATLATSVVWFNRSGVVNNYPYQPLTIVIGHQDLNFKNEPNFEEWNLAYQVQVKYKLNEDLTIPIDLVNLIVKYVNGNDFYPWNSILSQRNLRFL